MADTAQTPSASNGSSTQNNTNESTALTLVPICDFAGYACYVTWAFLVAWDIFIVPTPLDPAHPVDATVLRCWYFIGVGLASIFVFLFGNGFLNTVQHRWHGIPCTVCCLLFSPTLFFPLPPLASYLLWFVAGVGQTGLFVAWCIRLSCLEIKQQTIVVCGSFIVAGCTMVLLPFTLEGFAGAITTLLPLLSFLFMLLAWRRFTPEAGEDGSTPSSHFAICEGVRKLSAQIPFKDDVQTMLLKGTFALLYSMILGLVTALALAKGPYPLSVVIIGLGNALSALLMIGVLRSNATRACNELPRLFLGVSAVCLALACADVTGVPVIVSCLIIVGVFGFYEIINAFTSYACTSYDKIRYAWDNCSARMGNSVGFSLGWCIACVWVNVGEATQASLCLLSLVMLAVISFADSLLLKRTTLHFRDDEEAGIGVKLESIKQISIPPTLQQPSGRGRWRQACEYLIEHHGLTERQTDVFMLLAKGRNTQHIRETLVLSSPTVKSHTYSIYQKLEVHSHQELLDVIEETVGLIKEGRIS